MRALERLSFQIQLKSQYVSRTGDEFQQLFADIMVRAYPEDYQRICPWGSDGDRKNDGYLKSERKLFQCYAPHELRQRVAVKKIDADFVGALPHWEEHFDEWVFVHNVLRGTPAFVAKKLLSLERIHAPLRLRPWGYDELSRRLLDLKREDIVAVLGEPITDEALSELEFEDLANVIRTVAETSTRSEVPPRPVPADKLYENGLSEDVEAFLRTGMRKADLVGRFFDRWYDPTLGQRTTEAFRKRYEELKARRLSPDEIFYELQMFAGGLRSLPPKPAAAVLAVLAHFFEACDIFEKSARRVAA